MSEQNHPERPGRWQRREKRRKAERKRIQKHGAGLGRVYRDVVLKRLQSGSKAGKQSGS